MGASAGSLIPLETRSFGRYELLARLAIGGMAELFLARLHDDPGMSDSVLVIKRVLPHLAEDSRFVSMFRDEARIAARIEHSNVCRVLDQGSVAGTYFLALEYLHGMPLSRIMLRATRVGPALDFRLVAGLMMQCCAGLHHAHELRDRDGTPLDVVHRDISPPNIFVTTGGLVKLLDFGVAKAQGATEKTRTGTVKGKNAYMSPEQVLGRPMDRRSDLFSLGIVLWEALTATRLFARDVDFETFRAITRGDVPDVRALRPDTPPELAEVVKRALALDRRQRFATALELGDAVAAAAAAVGRPAGEPEIAAFLNERFAPELRARDRLIEATGTTARVDRGRARHGAAARVLSGGAMPAGRGRANTDPSAEAVTVVRTPPAGSAEVQAIEEPIDIRSARSRRSEPMAQPGADLVPQAEKAEAVTPVPSSPVRAQGSRPLGRAARGWLPGSGTGMGAGPRSITMRVLPLPAPALPRSPPEPAGSAPPPRPTPSPRGDAAAASVFLAGLSGLLLLLWWLT